MATSETGLETGDIGDGDPGDGDPGDGDPGDGDPGDGDPGDGDPGDGDPGDGDGDPGDGDPGDGDGDPGDVPCDEFDVQVMPTPPNMMFVLDKSGSMSLNSWLDGNQVKTRWQSLHDVVSTVVGDFDDAVHFGAKLYPDYDAIGTWAGGCNVDPVEVECAPMNGANVIAALPPANANVQGGTPMYDGLDVALTYMLTLPANEPRIMILVADGDVSNECGGSNNQNAVEALVDDAWATHGIPTYVVGIDISGNVGNFMDDVAVAGGKAKNGSEFYNTQDGMELQAVFQDIVDSSLGCIMDLEEEPAFPDATKVFVDGVEWPNVMDCDSEDGWVYTNPNGPYDGIQLCGGACESLKVHLAADVEYHCNPN